MDTLKTALRHVTSDRALLLALVLAALLGFYGLWWGKVESWNPDEMALRGLTGADRGLLEPQGYDKPPFHTYFNFFLSRAPLRAAEKIASRITGEQQNFDVAVLMWSRVLQLMLLLGTVYLTYRVVERAAGLSAARLIALITATSAGFILQVHFLTADIPVVFWMLWAFLLAQSIAASGRMQDYVLAGLLTGIATATKYNGLAVGLAIPIFHWFATPGQPLLKRMFDLKLVIGVTMVVVGFFLVNPWSLIRFSQFIHDFYYNYAVAPVYAGQSADARDFSLFPLRVVEIIGWPVAVLSLLGALTALMRFKQKQPLERATLIAAWGVFLLYYSQFGGFPRLEVRFVLPCVPFLLIAAASAWAVSFQRYRTPAIAALSAIVIYNVAASIGVSYRFAEDPRMHAQSWLLEHVPAGAKIESSTYVPNWSKLPGAHVQDVRVPHVSFRRRVLTDVLKDNPKAVEMILASESDEGVAWYDPRTLAERKPDYVAVDSVFYRRFMEGPGVQAYPEVHAFLKNLLAGKLGYRVVYDEESTKVPRWLYPRDIVFVTNRVVILQREVKEDRLTSHDHRTPP